MAFKNGRRALFIGTCIALASASPAAAAPDAGAVPIKQPEVSRLEYMLDVAADLAPGSAAEGRLIGWIEALAPGYGDRVSIDLAGLNAAPRVTHVLSETLARFGVSLSPNAPVSPTPIEPGKVRVILRRATAQVPGCPNYKGIGGSDINNRGIPSYGCAINGNLAAMIADPNDFIEGRTAPAGEGWRAAQDAKMVPSAGPALSGSYAAYGTLNSESGSSGSAGHD